MLGRKQDQVDGLPVLQGRKERGTRTSVVSGAVWPRKPGCGDVDWGGGVSGVELAKLAVPGEVLEGQPPGSGCAKALGQQQKGTFRGGGAGGYRMKQRSPCRAMGAATAVL